MYSYPVAAMKAKPSALHSSPAALLLFATLITSLTVGTKGQQGHHKVQAVGRTAQLGQFYDARTEQFLAKNIFQRRLPSTAITTTEVPWMKSHLNIADKQSDKNKLLSFDLKLSVSLMYGIVKVEAGCQYLKKDKDTSASLTSYLTYESRTVKDTLDVFRDDVGELLSDDHLSTTEATHVVTAVEYGANAVVQFQHSSASFQDTQKISAELTAKVEALILSASAKANIFVEDHYLTSNGNTRINIYGDIPAESTTPQSFEEVKEYIQQIPALTKKYNDGKGKPIVYTLFPIEAIRQARGIASSSPVTLKEVNPKLLQHLLQLTDQMEETKLLLQDLRADVKSFKDCITTPDFQRLNLLSQNYLSLSETFKDEVKVALIAVRSGQQSDAYLQGIISSYTTNPASASSVKTKLREDPSFQNIYEKLRIYKTLVMLEKAEYRRSLSSLPLINPGKNVYVMYYSPELVLGDTTAWLSCLSLFQRLRNIPSNHMIVLDCEFPSADCGDLEKVILRQYRNGKLISDDADGDFQFAKPEDSLRIHAFGRRERVGALYNARNGRFVSSSILQQGIFDVKEELEYSVESRILYPRTFLEKLDLLRIPPEVAVQVLTESVECRGSCEFIKAPLASHKTTGTYLLNIESSVETALDLVLEDGLDLTSALESGATHFVRKVIYGARTVTQIEIPKDVESSRASLLKFDLEDLREFTGAGFGNSSAGAKIQMNFGLKSNGSAQVFSDLLETSKNFKEDKDGLKLFMKDLPKIFASVDQAKGVPIAYVLEPFKNSEIYFGSLKQRTAAGIAPAMTGPDYQEIVSSYEQILEAQAEIASWRADFEEQKYCVLGKEEKVLDAVGLRFETRLATWLADLKEGIGGGDARGMVTKLSNLTDHYKISKGTVQKELQRELGWTMKKIRLIKAGKRNNIGYVGRGSLGLTEGLYLKTYVFYLKREFASQMEPWSKALSLFYSLCLPKNRLFFFDCDFKGSSCSGISHPTVHEYVKGVGSGSFPGRSGGNNSKQAQKLQESTAALVDRLDEIKLNATNQFESSLSRVGRPTNVTLQRCGPPREKLLEAFARLMCLPAVFSCPAEGAV